MGIEGADAPLGAAPAGEAAPTSVPALTGPVGATGLRAREQGENFPIALRVLPRRQREQLHAAYAFARSVDEIGDSFTGDRTARLHEVDRALDRLWAGRATGDPVLDRLRSTGLTALPAQPFHRLVAANLQDQVVSRYDTFDDLLGYCRLSADPVGRIVLGIFGPRDAERSDPTTVAMSDRVCTALQLLEHWQDVAEDRRAGRVYLPQEDLARYGVDEAALDRTAAGPEVRALMRFEIGRAADVLAEGAPIVDRLRGWARICVAGFVAGGQATAAALRRTGGDVLAGPARPSKPGIAARLAVLTAVATGRSAWHRTTSGTDIGAAGEGSDTEGSDV